MEVVQSPQPADIQAEASVEKCGHVVIGWSPLNLTGVAVEAGRFSAKPAHRDRFRKIIPPTSKVRLDINTNNFSPSNSAANLSRW
jgi:hypothetical protein